MNSNQNLKHIRIAELGIESTINALKESAVLWTKFINGAWNTDGKIMPTEEVYDLIRKSSYGATAYLVYDGEPKDDDENLLYVEVCTPCNSDMY